MAGSAFCLQPRVVHSPQAWHLHSCGHKNVGQGKSCRAYHYSAVGHGRTRSLTRLSLSLPAILSSKLWAAFHHTPRLSLMGLLQVPIWSKCRTPVLLKPSTAKWQCQLRMTRKYPLVRVSLQKQKRNLRVSRGNRNKRKPWTFLPTVALAGHKPFPPAPFKSWQDTSRCEKGLRLLRLATRGCCGAGGELHRSEAGKAVAPPLCPTPQYPCHVHICVGMGWCGKPRALGVSSWCRAKVAGGSSVGGGLVPQHKVQCRLGSGREAGYLF